MGRVTVLATAVALVVGVMFAAALVAILSLRSAENEETKSAARTVAALRVENLAVDIGAAVRGYTISGNESFYSLYRSARRRLPKAFDTLNDAVAGDPVQQRRAALAEDQIRDYIRDYAELVIRLTKTNPAVASNQAANGENQLRAAEIRSTLADITTLESRRSASRSARVHEVTRSAIYVGAGALVLSAALVLLFGAWVAREVARPVRETTKAAAQVASGDFGVRLDERAAGEVGALVSAFNSMARSLDSGRREVLAQNQQLRESEQHKRDLISMVSHELRTPLASVLGFTTLLLERDFPPDEQRRYLEIVDAQARRLAALAGDFLDVQLLEGGAMRLDRSSVDLIELTNEQIRLFFSHLDTHQVVVDLPDEPVVIDGDRDRLAQVIGNLLSNAIKYSPAGGTVHVRIELEGERAVLAVDDQGMGIDEADREHVFEKFFRSSEASARIAGTGLGLAVAREIVETHGGAIRVRSQPGAGSTFWIELPLRRTAAAAAR